MLNVNLSYSCCTSCISLIKRLCRCAENGTRNGPIRKEGLVPQGSLQRGQAEKELRMAILEDGTANTRTDEAYLRSPVARNVG
ncbi:hypothetical protein M513_09342 [Trichuris suis]|uniref:Uncharacterized protein n=1 Tax=Trichuris suis TaxID=68888 RepID=A0A085LXQ1_9BILA|nr:hypothetical protein M513_09342 [Trichuris suis]